MYKPVTEADLWRAADSLRANADLKPSEYATPVLGPISLKFAARKDREHEAASQDRGLFQTTCEHVFHPVLDHAA